MRTSLRDSSRARNDFVGRLSKTPLHEVELLGTPQVLITLYGPHGETVATAFFIHIDGTQGSRDPKNAKGSLYIGGKSYALTAKDLDAIKAIGAEPRTVADLVWGADRVVFTKPMEPWMNVDSTDAALVRDPSATDSPFGARRPTSTRAAPGG